MIKKISMLAVTAAAFAVVLAGCVKAPATPVTPSLQGTWQFQMLPVQATIAGESVTVIVGDGMMPISADPKFAKITQVVVMGTLTEDAEEMTFSLMLAGDDAIAVTLLANIPPAHLAAETIVAQQAIEAVITAAQGGTVMIDLDTSVMPDTMTVTGSFIDALLTAAGAMLPEGGLTAIRIG